MIKFGLLGEKGLAGDLEVSGDCLLSGQSFRVVWGDCVLAIDMAVGLDRFCVNLGSLGMI